MARKKKASSKSEIALGKIIENRRLYENMTRKQLGKATNQLEQKIAAYEKGEFVPLPVIEAIGLAFNDPVPKKIIRRISTLRKKEITTGVIENELNNLYEAAFEIDEDGEIT